jgi:hypothetical protein
MKPLRFWLPLNGYEREIIILGDYVESIMVPAAEHEAGHVIAAYHHGARVLGIAVGFIPERDQQGMFLQALYQWKDWSIDTQCVVKAAGPAADELYRGGFSGKGASVDLRDIALLTGKASLEPYLGMAKEILAGYPNKFKCIAAALRKSIDSVPERTLGLLPDSRVGAMLLDEAQLMQCLAAPRPSGSSFPPDRHLDLS